MNVNSVEVFKIAERLEEVGEKFYRKAAAHLKDPKISQLLSDLADMEKNHHIEFARMEKKSKSCGYMESEEIQAYLSDNFSPDLFSTDDAGKIGTELSDCKAILKFALKKEIESRDFYKRVREEDGDPDLMASLGWIIAEEEKHIELIREFLEASV